MLIFNSSTRCPRSEQLGWLGPCFFCRSCSSVESACSGRSTSAMEYSWTNRVDGFGPRRLAPAIPCEIQPRPRLFGTPKIFQHDMFLEKSIWTLLPLPKPPLHDSNAFPTPVRRSIQERLTARACATEAIEVEEKSEERPGQIPQVSDWSDS